MGDMPHIVAIGGGGGATQVLQAAQPLTDRLTAVIAVTDTGRSTGLARSIGGIPAPGDLRATIAAFARNRPIADLLQHRLSDAGIAQLEGMAFGNLMLAALGRLQGDFGAAVAQLAQLADCAVQVLPVATADSQLCAVLADDRYVEGELAVRGLNKPPIARVFLREPAPAFPAALAAIGEADLVVLGPGSLFTTLLATLLFDGMAAALQATPAQVVYVCNTTTQPGQTDGYGVLEHLQRLVEVVGPGVLDAALINTSQPEPAALAPYQAEGLHLLRPSQAELDAVTAMGIRPITGELAEPIGTKRVLWNKQDTVRHDPAALQAALSDLLAKPNPATTRAATES